MREARMHTEARDIPLENVHPETKCKGRVCVIHSPTDHSLRNQPIRWNSTGFFERLCEHVSWVLDPDQLDWLGADRVEEFCCGYRLKGGPEVECGECGDIIRSMYRHDLKVCECGATFVDGGTAYTRIGGPGVVVDGR